MQIRHDILHHAYAHHQFKVITETFHILINCSNVLLTCGSNVLMLGVLCFPNCFCLKDIKKVLKGPCDQFHLAISTILGGWEYLLHGTASPLPSVCLSSVFLGVYPSSKLPVCQRVECWPTASAVLQLREGVPFVSADLHSICCVRLLVKSLSSQ